MLNSLIIQPLLSMHSNAKIISRIYLLFHSLLGVDLGLNLDSGPCVFSKCLLLMVEMKVVEIYTATRTEDWFQNQSVPRTKIQ